jgi:hypothetical protein
MMKAGSMPRPCGEKAAQLNHLSSMTLISGQMTAATLQEF